MFLPYIVPQIAPFVCRESVTAGVRGAQQGPSTRERALGCVAGMVEGAVRDALEAGRVASAGALPSGHRRGQDKLVEARKRRAQHQQQAEMNVAATPASS